MERCQQEYCPNRSVCYHCKKEIRQLRPKFEFGLRERKALLDNGYIVHESVCNGICVEYWHLLKYYKSYNITIPFKLYEPYLDKVKDQVQITVRSDGEAEAVKEFQKLFLVKDIATFEYFLAHSDIGFGTHKVHYLFDKDYITKEKLNIATAKKLNTTNKTITLDSCYMGYVVNNECNFNTNYIDITWDGTIRHCPYSIKGTPIPEELLKPENYHKLFEIKIDPVQCKYSDIWRKQ